MPLPPPFRAPYAQDDVALARELFAAASLAPERERAIDALAGELIGAIREQKGGIGGVEELLREYSLSTREGLALMVLAEALLRVPDGATADRLIEDKLGQGDFARHETKSDALLVSASSWALGLTARVIQPGETPEGILGQLVKRMGLPTVRMATRQAMRVLGNHFVLGETIEDALKRATSKSGRIYRYSFDMLGEGARTAGDARRYWQSYADAIAAIGAKAGNDALPNRPGISVKLSALHPRYEAVSEARVLKELVPQVVELARMAKTHDLNFTIDAEEADRLELSLDVIAAIFKDSSLRGWDGFGLAIQAYQKRARAVIAWIDELAASQNARMMVRLVKGAYWDTEVKRAQERGLSGYPVYTRKAMTDLSYAACAQDLLARRPRLFPQFATHNALTIATVLEYAGDAEGFEFQRLHGMGEAAYAHLIETKPGVACRTYAPVGGYRDLLAYLVRRLLENGANSSFVSVAADSNVPVAQLLTRPQTWIGSPDRAANAKLPLPRDLYGAARANSAGVELGHEKSRATLEKAIADARRSVGAIAAAPIVDGKIASGAARAVTNPATGESVGQVIEADAATVDNAMRIAAASAESWNATPADKRAAALERAADLMQQREAMLIALLQSEAGKTIDDSIAEVREAIDFLRYYAAEARKSFGAGEILPGPTGEENRLVHRGRGVFVCISPWNFPLAIFTGQVSAALAAGNAVIAKPAEQTPLIAFEAVKIMHEAGVAANALHLLSGDGRVGAALVAHPQVAGVAFTGSTEVARLINRALAAKDGPIVPLIAETGGVNAMIVDATALPEQVADDVITSAFRSAGQRCSALRLLCVQEDVADKIIEMIVGAARELKIGDPADSSVHVGPVIDGEAKDKLEAYIARVTSEGKKAHAIGEAPAAGTFVQPHIIELKSAADLREEVFGPVLHIARWKADRLDPKARTGLYGLLADISSTGYGLTMGLHTRINETMALVEELSPAGNLYINRNIIGAVVGTQPFGGSGLSGTGPKAGGPNYLKRFAHEQVVSINTAAAGGNASLLAMGE